MIPAPEPKWMANLRELRARLTRLDETTPCGPPPDTSNTGEWKEDTVVRRLADIEREHERTFNERREH